MEIKNNSNIKSELDDSNIFNKNKLVKIIKEENNITETEAADALQYVIKAIKTIAFKPESEIRLVGLFTIKFSITEPRDATNPKTGEKIHVSHRVKTSFTVSKALKKEILLKNNK
ncbi:MAG: HU family DNA-binding protein [Rickettsiales bacterium]